MKGKEQGFSLLEAMMVLVLIGLLGLVALPNTKMIYKQQTNKFAKEMALDLTTQRFQSITRVSSGETLLAQSLGMGNYDKYQLTPANMDAGGNETKENKGPSPDMQIVMQAASGSNLKTISRVIFSPKGELLTEDNDPMEQLVVTITYNGVQTELIMEAITGHYEIK